MLFQVARQSYFDMNDILLGTCCHFLHCLIFKFLCPNATTRDSVNFQTNSGSSIRSMPLARKFLLSDLLSNLLSLRISSASKFSSMLNLSVLQASALPSIIVSPLLLVPLLSSCVFPSAVCYMSISTLLYASYCISSSVFRGQGSFVSFSVSTDRCFLCRLLDRK